MVGCRDVEVSSRSRTGDNLGTLYMNPHEVHRGLQRVVKFISRLPEVNFMGADAENPGSLILGTVYAWRHVITYPWPRDDSSNLNHEHELEYLHGVGG